ncbi:hypothetical protein AaE_008134 [Aphanomyces astaci]|uniref:Uncharacterized protein n=1 Tax=Aphanomyces astaci TaxID=112090 RepID=A0A6A5ACF1_APHAT|nr:hypothetical protein AaE_008134 [Aphanomyces astaci]
MVRPATSSRTRRGQDVRGAAAHRQSNVASGVNRAVKTQANRGGAVQECAESSAARDPRGQERHPRTAGPGLAGAAHGRLLRRVLRRIGMFLDHTHTLFRSLQRPKDSVVEVVRAVDDDAELDERESDTYTLDGSIFQNEWTWFQAGVQAMEEVLVTASSAAIRAQWGQYHASPRWTEPAAVDRIVPDVSPEFTGGVALFRHHLVRRKLVFAHASLNPSSFEMYWKALSKELDGHVLAIVLQLKVLTSCTYLLAMSKNGRLQFTHDVDAVTLVLRPYTNRPDAYVRRLVEASAVLHMPTAKARVLGDALATQHKLDMSSVQIQTMLEASQLHALTPSNVSTLLRMGA